MSAKILTFVDASVLIYAAKKPTAGTLELRSRALLVLADPDREFAASEFLRMETLPFAVFSKNVREQQFYETFFTAVIRWAEIGPLLKPASQLSRNFGIGTLDALHLAAAGQMNAEFISAEKPSKPIYRAYSKAASIY